MARVLLTWELGGGLGHCANLRPIVEHLVHEGHDVFLALRNVCLFDKVFAGLNVSLLQAPPWPMGEAFSTTSKSTTKPV